MSDGLLQVARWVASGTLAPWAVEDKTVVQMARKLLEAADTSKKVPSLWFAVRQQTSEGKFLDKCNIVRRLEDDSGWEHHGLGGFEFLEAIYICNYLNKVKP